MKGSFFESMKGQMVPDSALVSGVLFDIQKEKRESASSVVLRYSASALSVAIAVLCVFNMTMPAAAEKLPLVGGAFAALNESGRQARENGKTPAFLICEEEKQGLESIDITAGRCDGLDLSFFIRYEDDDGVIDEKVKSLTLSDSAVYYEGMALRPTNEAPILYETEEGVFSGEARFNASAVTGLLEDGAKIEFALHFNTVFGYWDGMEEGGGEAFQYEGTFISKSTAVVDLSKMSVEYVGAEKDGMSLEYIVSGGERTDVLFKISGSVEYADCFLVGTESEIPDCVTMNPGMGEDGSRTYCATFSAGEKAEAGGESVKDDKNESIYISPDDVVFYNEATGEYYYLSEKEE